MKNASMFFLIATISFVAFGCAHPPAIERDMLKTLLDKEIAISAEQLFNARYNPKDGHLIRQSEILDFLSARKVAVESLPPGLQSALKKNRVIGVLVSRLDGPISPTTAAPVPRMLGDIHAMLLAWEQSEWGGGGSGGFSGLWLDGEGECPGNQNKCDNYPVCATCAGGICACVGIYQCPPCQKCRKCPGPNVATSGSSKDSRDRTEPSY